MEQRTNINPACYQQVLDSAPNAKAKGQSQFFTPLAIARLLTPLLADYRPCVVDLNCGQGHLLHAALTSDTTALLGCDIDPGRLSPLNAKARPALRQHKITGDLTRLYSLFHTIGWQADCFVLNPPFGLHWYREHLTHLAKSEVTAVRDSFPAHDEHVPRECIDSTIATLLIALDRCTMRGEGFLIANEATLQRLIFAPGAPYAPLAAHIWLHVTFAGNVMTGDKQDNWGNEFTTGVIWFARAHTSGVAITRHYDTLPQSLPLAWRERRTSVDVRWGGHECLTTDTLWHGIAEEQARLNGDPNLKYHLWLDKQGFIHTHLSLYDERHPKTSKTLAARLHELNGLQPMQLVLQRATRNALEEAVFGNTWRVDPALAAAVSQAVHEYHAGRAPLYPLPEIQRLGYLDEQDFITCRRALRNATCRFKAGESYPIETKTGKVTRKCFRPNLQGEEELIEYSGSELFILITDADGHRQVFTEARFLTKDTDLSQAGLPECEPLALEQLTAHFEIPNVPDVATVNPGAYALVADSLQRIAAFCGITPKQFQYEDIARAALHDGLICAWDTGLGKTWFMFLWSLCKTGWTHRDGRLFPMAPILLAAPEDLHARIIEEAARYFRTDVIPLNSQTDFYSLATVVRGTSRTKEWSLAPAFYITSYTQLTGNGVKDIPDGKGISTHEWLTQLGFTVEDVARAFSAGGIAADPKGYYELLDVPRSATPEEITKSWRKLCGLYHPDKHPDNPSAEAKMKAINHAYDTLKQPDLRSAYDASARNGTEERFDFNLELEDLDVDDLLKPVKRYRTFDELPPKAQEDAIRQFCLLKRATFITGNGTSRRGIKCVYSPSLSDLTYNLFDVVAVDEGVRLQGGFNTIVGAGVLQMNPKYRAVLTATPIKNRLPQIFPLAWWATGGKSEAHARFPYKCNDTDLSTFSKTYLIEERNHTKERKLKRSFRKTSPQVCNVLGLWKLMAPIILRRRKKDIGCDIVAKRKEIIRVPMGKHQHDVYDYHLKSAYRDNRGRPAPGAKVQALRSVAGDPTSSLLQQIPHGDKDRGLKCRSRYSYTPKMAATLKLISQLVSQGEQVVVFSAFLDPLDRIEERLNQAKVPCYKLDGRTTGKKRGGMSLHFGQGRDSGIPVTLGGVESVAEGHNWPLCSHVILIAYSWAMDKMLQAVDRVYRLNSIKDVTVHCVVCDGTVDRKLESLLDEKEDAAELVLDGRLMGDNPEEINLAELLQIAAREFDSDSKTIDEVALEKEEWPLVKRALEEAMTQWHMKIDLETKPQGTETKTRQSGTKVLPTETITPSTTNRPPTTPHSLPPMPKWQRPTKPANVISLPSTTNHPPSTPPAVPLWKQRLWRRTYETCETTEKA